MTTYLLKTKRLGLTLLKESDITFLISLEADPDVKRYFPSGPRDAQATQEMIARFMNNYTEKGLPNFMLFELESGEFVGRIGFGIAEHGETEVGYVLHKKFWGKGYASEALSCVLEWAKTHIPIDEIIAYATEDNEGSLKVMEKCGMRYYKTGIHKGEQCKYYRIKNRI